MRFRTHLWTSVLTGIVLYPGRPRSALALTLAGVLIDLDHYVIYARKSGDWTPWGALRYNRYRHLPAGRRDPRPRFGPLRSRLHHPLVGVGLGLLAWRRPALRPLAIGLGLHLCLDWYHMPGHWLRFKRAGWRCRLCGSRRKLDIHMVVHWAEGGTHNDRNLVVLCARCKRAAERSYPEFPPLAL